MTNGPAATLSARDDLLSGPRAARILLIEDEPLVRLMTADMLSESGHTVFEAENAMQALAHLEQTSEIDTIVADVNIPGQLDGIGVSEVALARRPDLRVVFVSGSDLPDRARPQAGRFLLKPYLPGDLAEAVAR